MPPRRSANRKRRAAHELDPHNLTVDEEESSDSLKDTFETPDQIAKRNFHKRKRPSENKKTKAPLKTEIVIEEKKTEKEGKDPEVDKIEEKKEKVVEPKEDECGSDVSTEPDEEPKKEESKPAAPIFGSNFKLDTSSGSWTSQSNGASFSFGGTSKPTFTFGSGFNITTNSTGFTFGALNQQTNSDNKTETSEATSDKNVTEETNKNDAKVGSEEREIKAADLDEIRKTTVPFTFNLPSSGSINFGSVKWGMTAPSAESKAEGENGAQTGGLKFGFATSNPTTATEMACKDDEPTVQINEEDEEGALLICRTKVFIKVGDDEVEGQTGMLERGVGRLVIKRIGTSELHLVASREGIGALLINSRVTPAAGVAMKEGRVLTVILRNYAHLLLGVKDKEDVHDDGRPRVHMLCFNLESEAEEVHKLLTAPVE